MFKRILFAIMLLAAQGVAAQGALDSVALRAMQVGRVMQQERVYLHFDNTAYYLGETMWFKAYVSFGADNRPSVLSKVLYVELVAPEGYVVETKKYKLDDRGCCNGEFELTPLLLSGYYEVRAYTRYMLNWGKDAVFSRVFPVFDKVNAGNWEFKNMLDRQRAYFEDGKWHSAEQQPEATLDFFPESGHLVAGLPSRVAFELRENEGLFSEETVTIFKNGTKLLECRPQHMGKGVFEITPDSGAEYHAEVLLKNRDGKEKRHRFELPKIESKGVVLRVSELDDSIEVAMHSNLADTADVGFVMLHRGTMGFYHRLQSNGCNARMAFAKNELPEGVNRVLLFVDNHEPLAERQFFIMHESLQQSSMESVRLRVIANGYHSQNLAPAPNEKITLKVVRDDGKPLPPGARLSLSLSDAAGRQATSYSHNIYTYMLLGSEIKGYLPDAAQYFDPANKHRKEHLDLVMLTHGWTSYDWSRLSRKKIADFHPVERGITLKGMFMQKHIDRRIGHIGEVSLTTQPYNLVRLDVANEDNGNMMTTFRTDSTGSFVVELDDFYGKRVASLKPQTRLRHSRNILYNFVLDRYYSPGFRMYDYWERHVGAPMSKAESDSLVRLNPFEYMLSSVEVVGERKKEMNGRPPHSEMRLDFLDEWEYAQDVTYLNVIDRFRDVIYETLVKDAIVYEKPEDHGEPEIYSIDDRGYDDIEYNVSDIISIVNKDSELDKYIGYVHYDDEISIDRIDHSYDNALTAADVVKSAIIRHGYHWAYWVQLMVVQGKYSQYEVPVPDMEYLHGMPDVDKMSGFKEVIIRSDIKTREQFENRSTYWNPLSRMLDNKEPVQKFYMGFLSHLYVYPQYDMTGCPDVHAFSRTVSGGPGISYPINPNYVACLVPYSDEEREDALIPDYSVAGNSAMRYTSVQGYSESKQFYSPDYSRMKLQESDYRRTLLWEPSVKVNGQGEAVIELYNSDVCSNLNASVEGRYGNILFSSDEIMATRAREYAEEVIPGVEYKRPGSEKLVEELEMDSLFRIQCDKDFETGLIYYNQKRYKNAIMIFAELVQYKYPPALYYVGRCYIDGTGVKKNASLAFSFLSEAAKYGEPRAQYELGMGYFKGDIAERDNNRALQWMHIAAEQDEPRALYELARRYSEGDGVVRDSIRADELLERGAKNGSPEAMFVYGKCLVENGEDGMQYIADAAESGVEGAMLYMSDHEHDAGNYKDAYRYAKQLHMLGNIAGTKRMAEYYMEGKGVKRDKGIARDLLYEYEQMKNKQRE